MENIAENNGNGNGRKVIYATGKPGELRNGRPGDTVVFDGQVFAIGYDGHLWFVKVEG